MEPAHPAPIDRQLAEQAIATGLSEGGAFAEVFCEYEILRSLAYEEGKLRSSTTQVTSGIAVRVISGAAQGLAYCETGRPADVLAAARQAAAIAREGAAGRAQPLVAVARPDRYPLAERAASVDVAARIGIAARIHDRAQVADPAVHWVQVSLVDAERWIQVAASDGTWAADYQPMLRATCVVLVQQDGRRERGYESLSRRCGFELFAGDAPERLADEAARLARFRLDAAPCPAATMPVVLAAGSAGVLIHEAVGHGLEADFNRKGVSAYAGRLGAAVAAERVTIIDEGQSPGERGALNIDDEGTPVGETRLIEDGVLRAYLTDKLSARLMDLPATGNGRRESYQSLPIPRMRITRMAAGDDDPAAMLQGIRRGFYARKLGGGSVDISKGDYNFEVMEGYLIEDGRITQPVRGATLVGNGPETLGRVDRVGSNACIESGGLTCGKDGQSAPVSVGTPSFRVSELVVGGEG